MSVSINFNTEKEIIDTGVNRVHVHVCMPGHVMTDHCAHVLPHVRKVSRLCMAGYLDNKLYNCILWFVFCVSDKYIIHNATCDNINNYDLVSLLVPRVV